jgi:HAMP domain-containing protein
MEGNVKMEKMLQKRRRYFIHKRFQLKYIGLILGIMVLGAAVSGYTIYYNSWLLLGEKLANVYPQGRLMQIFRSVNMRLAVNLLFVSAFCIIVAIFTSHKVAGPIYRMIKFLGEVTSGNYSQRVKLRKHDELKDLAEAINTLVDKLERERKS